MVRSKIIVLFIVMLTSIAGGLAGCSTTLNKEGMIASSIQETQRHKKTVAIKTQGGGETGPFNISNEDFAKAIEDSIMQNGLFTQVIHGDNSDYILNVTIADISKPLGLGFSFSVSMEAGWSLIDAKNKKIVMKESIKSTYTASLSESVIGASRYRLAVEGAVRENIRLGLIAVSKLKL